MSHADSDQKLRVCSVLNLISAFLFLCAHLWRTCNARELNANDCAAISAHDSCNCTYNAFDSILIYCSNADDSARVHITLQDADVIEVYCHGRIGVGCNATHPCIPADLLARLPRLRPLRKVSFIDVRYCMPFTELLTRLEISGSKRLQVHGLEFIDTLKQQHFGNIRSYLQSVKSLELLSQSPQHIHDAQSLFLSKLLPPGAITATQQLDAEVLSAFTQLRSLTIFMNFAQLPLELFTPVAHTLHELFLIGAMRNFPCKALEKLSILEMLDMSGHQLDARLQPQDFVALRALKELTLQRCNISALPALIFAPLALLERLILAQNKLRQLPSALLAEQRNLVILNLIDNQLELLPDGLLSHTPKLQELLLTFNRLRHISPKLVPPENALVKFYADVSQLHSVEVGTFAHARHLRELLLGDNQLNWTEAAACSVLVGLHRLEVLGLQNNSLQYLCAELGERLPRLQLLSAHHNKFTHLSAQLLSTLNESKSLRVIDFQHNPWLCDCSTQPLHTFVRRNRARFPELETITCNDTRYSAPLFKLAYNDYCAPELGVDASLVLMFTSVSAFSLFLLVLTLCYYKHRLQLKVWLYARGLCLRCISEAELDRERKYDAFISYAHADERFVEHVLVPGLEQGTPPFEVCIHARDWLVGAFISEQIVDSIEQSRRTIIVLSTDFLQSEWALMEFRMAHQRALNEGRARLILVVYGDLTCMEQMDQEVRAYLKMNTYLKWGEPWFWEKLRYAMPHSRRVWERARRARQRTNDVPLQVMSKR